MDEAINENTWDLVQHNESQWPFFVVYVTHTFVTHLQYLWRPSADITIMQLINTMLTPYTNPKPVFLARTSQASPQESVWHILLVSVAYNVQTKETELHLQMNNKEHNHSCVYFFVMCVCLYSIHIPSWSIKNCAVWAGM